MNTFQQLTQTLAVKQSELQLLKSDLFAKQEELKRVDDQIKNINNLTNIGLPIQDPIGLTTTKTELTGSVQNLTTSVANVQTEINSIRTDLNSIDPTLQIQNLDDNLPITLFPVRIETRFMKVRNKVELPPSTTISVATITIVNTTNTVVDGLRPYTGGTVIPTNVISSLSPQLATIDNTLKGISTVNVNEKQRIDSVVSTLQSTASPVSNTLVAQSTSLQNLISTVDTNVSSITSKNNTLKNSINRIKLLSNPLLNLSLSGVSLDLVNSLNSLSTTLTNANAVTYSKLEDLISAQTNIKVGLDAVNTKANLVVALLSTVQLNGILTSFNSIETLLTTFSNVTATLRGTQLNVVNDLINSNTELTTGVTKIANNAGALSVTVNQTPPSQYVDTDELWVRIYPDDISIDDLEKEFTQAELDAGFDYWNRFWAAKGNKTIELGVWRGIVERFGATRAAYIVKTMTPTNYKTRIQQPEILAFITTISDSYDNLMTSIDRTGLESIIYKNIAVNIKSAVNTLTTNLQSVTTVLESDSELLHNSLNNINAAATNVTNAIADGLILTQYTTTLNTVKSEITQPLIDSANNLNQFINRLNVVNQIDETNYTVGPVYPTNLTLKNSSWTKSPKVKLLPDKFIVRAYKNNSIKYEVIGATIPLDLATGIDPRSDIEENPNGDLVFSQDQNWMYDFKSALNSGMAVRIKITADEANPDSSTSGFDQLTVLGVRNSTTNSAQKEIEQLFDSHRYTGKGLQFIPTGTPTNNTDITSSGFQPLELQTEKTFKAERYGAQFDISNQSLNKTDGQRLAEALGVNPSVFQHAVNSNKLDVRDAIAMNIALWQATMGSFLEEKLGTVIHLNDIDKTRNFFIENVIGRGNLSSISVGQQPYGFITTTRFSKLNFKNPADGLNSLASNEELFLNKLNGLINSNLHPIWTDLSNKVKTVNTAFTSSTNTIESSQARLFDILGLLPNAEEFKLRYSASQGYTANFDELLNRIKSQITSSDWNELIWQSIYQDFKSIFPTIPFNDSITKNSNIFKSIFLSTTPPEERNLIDIYPISELKRLGNDEAVNYIHYLFLNKLGVIRTQRINNLYSGNTTLFGLLEYAQFMQYFDAAMRILTVENILLPETTVGTGDRKNYKNFRTSQDPTGSIPPKTKWFFLFANIFGLRGDFNQNVNMADYLESTRANKYYNHTKNLIDFKKSLSVLAELPSAQLERCFKEHIDLVSYRFDAWKLGLANKMLIEKRKKASSGLYIGAFGYIENLKPGPKKKDESGNDLTYDFNGTNEIPSVVDTKNQGFIHAPSVAHAITAAILRNGYLSEASLVNADKMAVDLSSKRVRKALQIINGIRVGKSLNELLGYEFERSLRKKYSSNPSLQKFVPELRLLFPIKTDQIQSTSNTSKPNSSKSDLHVVDGIELLNSYKTSKSPFSGETITLTGINSTSSTQIIKSIKGLEEMFDALSDLVLSEGVFQLARGNKERSNAVLESISRFDRPIPDPEILQTPLEAVTITNRIAVNFPSYSKNANGYSSTNSSITSAVQDVNPWPSINLTERAIIEPSLNNWIAKVLSISNADLGVYACTVTENLEDGTQNILVISLQDLKLQPIDLVYLVGDLKELNAQDNLFFKYIRFVLNSTRTIAKTSTLTIELNKIPSNDRLITYKGSIGNIVTIIQNVNELLNSTRPLKPSDLALTSSNTSIYTVDLEELRLRLVNSSSTTENVGLIQRLENHLLSINLIISNIDSNPNQGLLIIDNIYAQIKKAFEFNIIGSLPELKFDLNENRIPILYEALKNISEQITKKLTILNDGLSNNVPNNDLTEVNLENWYLSKFKSVFGDKFMVIPHFKLIDSNEFSLGKNLTSTFSIYNNSFFTEDYLTSVSLVRKNTSILDRLKCISDLNSNSVLNNKALNLKPIQLSTGNLDFWIGGDFPQGKEISGNAVNLIINEITKTTIDNNTIFSGILVEDWSEEIPLNTLTTGVAVNYNQPNSVAPQTVLVAVSPQNTGKWNWEDLHETIRETMILAKQRGVDPDIMKDPSNPHVAAFSQILPAISAEIVRGATDANTGFTDISTYKISES